MFVRLALVALVAVLAWAAFVRPSESAGPERAYVVQPADTLWSIAVDHYSGDPREAVWNVRKRNGLDGTTLHPGQMLILPRG
jgi:LysM repeat protein